MSIPLDVPRSASPTARGERRHPARTGSSLGRSRAATATAALLALLAGATGCASQNTDAWARATPGEVGLDPGLLDALGDAAAAGSFPNIHSVLVVRHGKLVMEEYFNGFGPNRLQYTASVSKSVGSILFGIAAQQGLVRGFEDGNVDVPLSTVLPPYADLLGNPGHRELTLSHVLTMTAGLGWDERSHPYSDPRNDWYQASHQEDPVRFVLDRPLVAEPGAEFNYNGGLSIILAQLLEEATGGEVLRFADQYLFGPLGIERYEWERLPNGMIDTDGGLHLPPRDMAKLGQLYLNGGRWNGRPVVPEAWVRASTQEHVVSDGQPNYGYQWWCGRFQYANGSVFTFMASGHGGQKIFVIPEMDLVVVITHAVFNNPMGELHNGAILSRYILPAADSAANPGQPVTLPESTLVRFAGEYGPADDGFTVRYVGGSLIAQAPGSPDMELTPLGDHRFRGTVLGLIDVDLSFELGEDDEAAAVRARYMFNDRRYARREEEERPR